MGWSRSLGLVSSEEVYGVLKMATQAPGPIPEGDAETLPIASSVARSATDIVASALGVSKVDLHVGGGSSFNENGSRSVNVTISISVCFPKE